LSIFPSLFINKRRSRESRDLSDRKLISLNPSRSERLTKQKIEITSNNNYNMSLMSPCIQTTSRLHWKCRTFSVNVCSVNTLSKGQNNFKYGNLFNYQNCHILQWKNINITRQIVWDEAADGLILSQGNILMVKFWLFVN
jgi:hypothetical protein